MSNTSASGGYLAPLSSPAPLEDQALDRFVQQVLVGVTGMAGPMVRPLWQVEPDNLPDVGVDWCAFGLKETDPDWSAAVTHDQTGLGSSTLQRHEALTFLVSFYGPNANGNAAVMRDGLQMQQNVEVLNLNGFGMVETGKPVSVPSLVKDKWLKRVDVPWTVRRETLRTYAVESLTSAHGTIDADGSTEFNSSF